MKSKSVIFTMLILITLFACKMNNESPYPGIEIVNDSFVVYNVEDYSKIFFENRKAKIKCIDTICSYYTKLALNDLKKGKRIYFTFLIQETEGMKSLLKENGIEYQETLFYDTHLGCFEMQCYQKTMNDYIYQEYGEHFIDSLKSVSIRDYLIKHPKAKFMEDGLDRRQEYLDGRR